MSCSTGVSNFERKKQALINVNLWKSNFINLWRTYGTFKTVEGVECFDYYDIDGDGEGQRKMSILLKQPTLYLDTQDDDLDWVHLFFNFSKLIVINDENIALWITYVQNRLSTFTFDSLEYTISDNRVTHATFLNGGIAIDDPFLNDIALLLAERNNVDVSDLVYSQNVTLEDVVNMIPALGDYPDGTFIEDTGFTLPMVERYISAYLLENGIGTDILDDLVLDGFLIGIGTVATSNMEYALPVDVAKKMNGFSFVALVTDGLDFDYKVESHWYDFFFKIIKLILAGVAAFFQFYYVAAALVVSFAADITGSEVLKVVSSVISLYGSGVNAIAEFGVSEAVNLLMNVYSLYIELSFKPEKTTDEEVVDNDQEMFYKAPHSAYSDLYCYKDLTSVSLDLSY